ncbi:tungstate ABC transporter substrate-binding protein WtpA [Candidatus Bipolaricaulota bacterium]|nr:tungstate ABC transporter substrate-binding protein WtpA [Candidatus Bipolaricaulota bacterium]
MKGKCLVLLLFFLGTMAFPQQLRVLVAGSLMVPFQALETAFEAQNPGVDVLVEGHGSIQCIRHVTELGQAADLVAVADWSLIPLLMYPTGHATWTLRFASNRLGIAYTPESAYAQEMGQDNWYRILARPDVRFGFSDPRFDACGYRTLMLLRLADLYYGEEVFAGLLEGEFVYPFRLVSYGEESEILVPEVVQPRPGSRITLRGSSVGLLGLLETGDLDYGFQYESVARQHGLCFLSLPPQMDLSEAGLSELYSRVRVHLAFRRFQTVTPAFQGRPIVYGLTIPTAAPHPELAAGFIRFLLGPQGKKIMGESHQPLLPSPEADEPQALPAGVLPP